MPRRALLAAALCLAAVPAARANGDPASDFLLTQNVFLPFSAQLSNDARTAFASWVGGVVRSGYRLKVAVIAAPLDLGAVPSLFRQPQRYARFLGQELPLTPSQTLLVVMPNGYGVYRVGMPIARERQALAAVAPPGTREPQALVAGAARAVRRLAGLRGVSAPPFDAAAATRKRTSEWGARLELAAIVAGALALAGAASYLRRRRTRT